MKKYKTTAYKDESPYFYGALLLLVFTFLGYIYFVSEAVAYVVMRKEVDAQIGAVGTSVSVLEAEYIDLQHSVSNEIAAQSGFIPTKTKIFIDTTVDTLVLSKN